MSEQKLIDDIKQFIHCETPGDVVFAHIESPYWDGVECHMAGDVLQIYNSENNELVRDDETGKYEPFSDYVLREMERRRELLCEIINYLKAGFSD